MVLKTKIFPHIFTRTFLLLLIVLFSSLQAISQNVNYAFIVVHVDPTAKGEFKQLLYAYHFLNGTYRSREELLNFKGRVKDAKGVERDYVRTDIGTNILYQNRYLITGIGNIIDLKEKKVIFDQKANVVRCSNDSVIYYTNDAFKGKYYSIYNLATKQYSEVKSLTFKAVAGQDIEFDKSAYPYKLNFYPTDKPKVVLMADAGNGQLLTGNNSKPDPSVWWLSKNEFVFPSFNAANTEISFIKVSIDTKATNVIGKGIIKQQNELASFTKLGKDLAQYNFGDKKFVIDLAKNTVTESAFTYPENNFVVECANKPYGHIIKLRDKEIGKYHFQLKNFRTGEDIAGLVKELVVGTDSYQQGLAVWNNTKPGWEKVDAEEVLTVIGWMKE